MAGTRRDCNGAIASTRRHHRAPLTGRGLVVNTGEIAEGLRSDPHGRANAHRADAVEFGLLAHIVGGTFARLVALVEQLDLL
jgi:hypothetical protein